MAGNPIIPRGAPYEGERFERFRDMATEGKRHGCLMVGQISHPGRQVSEDIQPNPVSASDVQLKGDVMGMKFAQVSEGAQLMQKPSSTDGYLAPSSY